MRALHLSSVFLLSLSLILLTMPVIDVRQAFAGTYFSLSASPSPLQVPAGSSASSVLTISSNTGDTGPGGYCIAGTTGVYTVLGTQVLPAGTTGLTATLDHNCILLDGTGKATVVLTVTASSTIPPGGFSIDVSHVSGCFGTLTCANYYGDVGQVPIVVTSTGVKIDNVDLFLGTRTTIQGTISSTSSSLSGSIIGTTVNSTTGDVLFSGTFTVSVLLSQSHKARFVLVEPLAGTPAFGVTCTVDANVLTGQCMVTRDPAITGGQTVNIVDASIVFRAYGSTTGSAMYQATADLDGDGRIDIIDCGIMAADFGSPVIT